MFEIAAGTTHMLNVTVQNGLSDNGTIYSVDGGKGGGILVDAGATLTMDGCLLSYNVAMGLDRAGQGGGIYNAGTLALVNSVLDANRATASP